MATGKEAPKKEAPKEAGKDAEKKKSKKGLFIIIIVLVLLVAGGGAGGWYWWTQMGGAAAEEVDDEGETSEAEEGEAKKPKKKKTQKKKEQTAPVFVALDAFTVNLQGDDNPLLQTAITLQLGSEEDAVLMKQHIPMVRSRLVLLLSSKRPEELLTSEGKNQLAKDIAAQIQQPFSADSDPVEVQNVLFTSFIVQ